MTREDSPDEALFRAFCYGLFYTRTTLASVMDACADSEPRKDLANALRVMAKYAREFPRPKAADIDMVVKACRRDGHETMGKLIDSAVQGVTMGFAEFRNRQAESQ